MHFLHNGGRKLARYEVLNPCWNPTSGIVLSAIDKRTATIGKTFDDVTSDDRVGSNNSVFLGHLLVLNGMIHNNKFGIVTHSP